MTARLSNAQILRGAEIRETGIHDALALLTVELNDGAAGGDGNLRVVESVRIMRQRDGETPSDQVQRIGHTIDALGVLGAAALNLAGAIARTTDAPTLLQAYALRLQQTETRRRARLYRTFDPNWRPPGMENHYCPVCHCNKSGDVDPNPKTEACSTDDCICHDDTIDMGEHDQ